MVQASAPKTNIWQAFILKLHPLLLAILQGDNSSSAQGNRDIHLDSNMHKTIALFIDYPCRFLDFPNCFTNTLHNFHRHVLDWDIMNLYPEQGICEIQHLD